MDGILMNQATLARDSLLKDESGAEFRLWRGVANTESHTQSLPEWFTVELNVIAAPTLAKVGRRGRLCSPVQLVAPKVDSRLTVRRTPVDSGKAQYSFAS
jgi:hypothetical protein